jgi:hypothetical protein
MSTKLIKVKENGHIIITKTFTPSKVQKKLINFLYKKIMNSEFKHHYDKTYHTQKYDLKYILTNIVCFINNYHSWRSLGNGWNNIYKHFIKLVEWKILDTSFIDLLKSYTNKRHGKHLKVVMVDTSTIFNKNGNDYIKRNYCVKNKFCTKVLTIVDDKGIPLYVNYNPGSQHDSECLIKILDEFLVKTPDIVTFLADAGFYTNAIQETLKKHGVKPIIAKNVKNRKTTKIYLDKNGKKRKLTPKEKIERQVEDFTNKDKKIFKKRHKVENVYANLKQKPHLSLRYDKRVINMYNLTLLYFCEKILCHI